MKTHINNFSGDYLCPHVEAILKSKCYQNGSRELTDKGARAHFCAIPDYDGHEDVDGKRKCLKNGRIMENVWKII